MDELTDPEPSLVAPAARRDENIGRTAATITFWNLVSRLSGFVRVVATSAALGIVTLGDTYQNANLVSNLLFEMLAGGLLFSVLVPTFVAQIDGGRRDDARILAGVLLTRAMAGLAVLVVVSIAVAPWIMGLLTIGVHDPVRRTHEIDLGAVLLWFIMPQLVLYAVGAVSTALLQADRRFVAAAVAPAFNNVVVTFTMVAFVSVHDAHRGIHLTNGEKALLGGGTLLGTVAMTAAPLLASWRAGLSAPLRWSHPRATGLGDLARKGAWGAGDIGLNQVMVAATVVFSGAINGGAAAYQTAFTYFVLPHAILAQPIFTALFPRLSAHVAAGDTDAFAEDTANGVRTIGLLLLPAAGLLAVTAQPLLSTIKLGRFDAAGVHLVASVLSAYMLGLLGYSGFFLLTRASYALGDVRSPTLIYLWTTIGAIAGMAYTSSQVHGDAKVVVLGLVHGVAVTLGAFGLFVRLRRRIDRPMPVWAALARGAVATAVSCGAAVTIVHAMGTGDRAQSVATVVLAGGLGLAAYVGTLVVLRTPELEPVWARLRRRRRAAA